jgi:nicotinate-nucleotide adenylyltransferase
MPAIGILGGSFDPVHNAHLSMARAALSGLALAKVLWIPSGTPPHRGAPVAPAEHRAAMVRLAIAGEPRFELDERELRKRSAAYTVETLEELRKGLDAQADLVLLIGADQYEKLDTWHRWRELFAFARIAVFARPDHAIDTTRFGAGQVSVVPMLLLDISSTDIRARIAAGEPVRAMVPDAVLDYIETHRLYLKQTRGTGA